MIDNKRQKVIFVNNTKITSEQEQKVLHTLSNKYSNAIFFTERKYADDNHIDHNIYINDKEYVPVRGIDPEKSVVAIKDKLFIMSLDKDDGRISLSTADSVKTMSLFKIFYTYEYDDDELNIYDFSDFNPNAYDQNYEYPSDRNNLYNERSFSISEDNDIHDTICLMVKCVASEEAISPILECPDINLYYDNNGTKAYLDKYISEFNTDNETVSDTHKQCVYSYKGSDGCYVSYMPYYFKIHDYMQLSHTIYAEYEYENTHKKFTVLSSANVVSPVISNYELVRLPEISNSSNINYFLYNRSENIYAKMVGENDEVFAVTYIDLSTYIFKVIPHRAIYGEKTSYDSLLSNLTYYFSGNIKLSFVSSDINFTLQTDSDSDDTSHGAQLIYDATTNIITIDKTKQVYVNYKNATGHYVNVTDIPLRSYVVTMSYTDFYNRYKNDEEYNNGAITIDDFKINKFGDNHIVYFRQYTSVMDETAIASSVRSHTTYMIQQSHSDEVYADKRQVVRRGHRYTIDPTMAYSMIVVDADIISEQERDRGMRVILQDPGVHALEEQQPIGIGATIDAYENPIEVTNTAYNKKYLAYDVSTIISGIVSQTTSSGDNAGNAVIFDHDWVMTVLEK